jgi:hypothetical protein
MTICVFQKIFKNPLKHLYDMLILLNRSLNKLSTLYFYFFYLNNFLKKGVSILVFSNGFIVKKIIKEIAHFLFTKSCLT